MKQSSSKYRVLVQTALFGTVRVTRGDVVRRELLGCNLRRLLDEGVVEPMTSPGARKTGKASLM